MQVRHPIVSSQARSGFRLSDLETLEHDRAGRPFCVRNHIIGIVENGCLVDGWSTQNDITEQKQAEQELRSSENRFRPVIENVSDVVTLMDADGTIRFESPLIEHMFGYGRAELVGRNAFDLLPPDDLARVSQDLALLLQSPGATSPVIELRTRHQDGSWRTLEVVGKCLTAPSGSSGRSRRGATSPGRWNWRGTPHRPTSRRPSGPWRAGSPTTSTTSCAPSSGTRRWPCAGAPRIRRSTVTCRPSCWVPGGPPTWSSRS